MFNPKQRFKDRFCKKAERKSFAINQLDKKLAGHLSGRNKFFIEAGGNDGIKQSNTLYFERYLGWKGLLIEAVPTLAEQCRINRPRCLVENCALVSRDFQGETVEIHYRNLMSMVKGGLFSPEAEETHLANGESCMLRNDLPTIYQTPARTLSDILDRHGITQIDLFSLDVEGYELEVLKGLDLNRHCPEYLLIEVRDETVMLDYLAPWYSQHDILHAYPNSHKDILYKRKAS